MSMTTAAAALLPANMSAEAVTRDSTSPVADMTAAKPWAVIMMKPMSAIIFMPAVNTSSAWCHLTAPVTMKIARPVSAPMSREFASEPVACRTTWMTKVATMATSATMTR